MSETAGPGTIDEREIGPGEAHMRRIAERESQPRPAAEDATQASAREGLRCVICDHLVGPFLLDARWLEGRPFCVPCASLWQDADASLRCHLTPKDIVTIRRLADLLEKELPR